MVWEAMGESGLGGGRRDFSGGLRDGKGNSIWRRELLASLEFDPVLNFDDAVMYGLDLCLQAKTRGFKLLYDPRALVYHHSAPRAPELDRQERAGLRLFLPLPQLHIYHSEKILPYARWLVFLCWWFLIGERGEHGAWDHWWLIRCRAAGERKRIRCAGHGEESWKAFGWR